MFAPLHSCVSRAAAFVLTIGCCLSTTTPSVAEEPKLAKVINGSAADEGEYPWMAAILYKYNGRATDEHGCGGSLIHPQYVLTAAHCVIGAEPEYIEVLLGQSKLSAKSGQRFAVRGVVLHPLFDSYTLDNDFALIKLETPAPYLTLEVAGPNDVALDRGGVEATLLGWGMTDPNRSVLPDILQEAAIPVIDDALCLERDGRWFVPQTMLCAGKLASSATAGDGVDACYGDSGGPLVTKQGSRWKQIGIVSWGVSGCADNKTHGIYARARAGYDFIYSYPTIAPRILTLPEISGTALPGKTLSVSNGSWGGDPVTTYSYQWFRGYSGGESFEGDYQAIEGATASTYMVTEADAGYQLSALVTTSNAGGYSDALANPTEYIELPPTPEPTPEPTPSDSSAPSSSFLGARCNSSTCDLHFSVQDDSGPGAVTSVSVTVKKRVPTPKGAKKSRVFTKQVSAQQVGTELWQVSLRRQRGARYEVFFAATDASGNVESPGLHLKLPSLAKLAALR